MFGVTRDGDEGSTLRHDAGKDRAAMELARKSVQRRTLALFGNHRVAGTLAGIGIVNLLLILMLPELSQSLQDAGSQVTDIQQQRHQLKSAADETAGALQTSGAGRPSGPELPVAEGKAGPVVIFGLMTVMMAMESTK
jgi:hypothetical protein